MNIELKTIGNSSLAEHITSIVNLVSNFDTDNAITRTEYNSIEDKVVSVYTFDLHKEKLRKYYTNNKLIQEKFEGERFNITVNRFTPTYSKPYYSGYNFLFKNTEFNVEYKTIYKSDISKTELSVYEKNYSNKTIYLPKVSVYTDIYGLNMNYVKNANYEVVDTERKLRDAIERCKRVVGDTEVVCYDAETTGLNFRRFATKKDFLCTHSISWEDNQSIIIPVRMRYEQNIKPEIANEYLKTVLEVNPILAHNGAADIKFLKYDDIKLNLQEDTMHLVKHILPYITKEGETPFNRYLDDLVKKMFGLDMIDMSKYVFKPSNANFDFSIVNKDYMIWYGCPDTDLCRQLWKVLITKLPARLIEPYKWTVRFSKVLAVYSGFAGLGINSDAIVNEKERCKMIADKLQELIYAITGEDRFTLSLTSSQQKSNYIFGKMGAPIEMATRRTESGLISADKTIIERLSKIKSDTETNLFKSDILDTDGSILIRASDLNNLKYPVTKLMSTFSSMISNIKNHYNRLEKLSQENIFYPDFSVGKTDTWRTTEGIQTIKNSLKSEVGAPNNKVTKQLGETWYWSTTDYRTQEICLAANQSNDFNMIDMLCDVEADSHTMTASEIFSKPPYLVTTEERSGAKTCGFGILYGMRYKTLGQRIFQVDILSPEQDKYAKDLYTLYQYKKAELLQPLEVSKSFVKQNGYLVNKVNYRMIYPSVTDKPTYIEETFDCNKLSNDYQPQIDIDKRQRNLGILLNACGNYPIQSWAAGTLMKVYPDMIEMLERDGYSDYITVPLTVHDEVGTCFRVDKVHPYYIIHLQLETLVDKMEYLNRDKVVPLYIGVGFGKHWKEAKSDKSEIPIKLQYELQKEFLNGTCPTIEEILKEGIYEHFLRRKREYMVRRCIELFPEMYEDRKWYRFQVEDTLNKYEMYVGKEMNAIFNIYLKGSTIIDMEVLLRALYGIDDKSPLENISYEEGEHIEDTIEEVDTDSIELFYLDKRLHERVVVEDRFIQVNLNGLSGVTRNNIIKYLQSLDNPTYNIHNKYVIMVDTNGKLKRLDINILSIPMNFSDSFEDILRGNLVNIRNITGIEFDEDLIYFDNNELVITTRYIELINKDMKMVKQFETVISSISSKSVIATLPIVIKDNKTDIVKDSGLRMVNINSMAVDKLLNIVRG